MMDSPIDLQMGFKLLFRLSDRNYVDEALYLLSTKNYELFVQKFLLLIILLFKKKKDSVV